MQAESAAAAADQAATSHQKQLRAEQRYALLFGPYSSTLCEHVLTKHPKVGRAGSLPASGSSWHLFGGVGGSKQPPKRPTLIGS